MMSYNGNKRKEVEKIYDEIKNKIINVKYIVEPFCGSCALSYYISLKHPDKYTYILNDNNKFLIELLELCKDEEKIQNLKAMHETAWNNKENYLKICNNAKTGDLKSWFYINKYYSIRAGLMPLNTKQNINFFDKFDKSPFIDFLKKEKTIILNDDALNIYDVYKNKEDALIFLDPPYLTACNDYYAYSNINIYEYLHNNNIKNEKALICLCINDIWITRLLFKDVINIVSYNKKYDVNGKDGKKKEAQHIIIVNH